MEVSPDEGAVLPGGDLTEAVDAHTAWVADHLTQHVLRGVHCPLSEEESRGVRKVVSQSKFTEQIFTPQTETQFSNACANYFTFASGGNNSCNT